MKLTTQQLIDARAKPASAWANTGTGGDVIVAVLERKRALALQTRQMPQVPLFDATAALAALWHLASWAALIVGAIVVAVLFGTGLLLVGAIYLACAAIEGACRLALHLIAIDYAAIWDECVVRFMTPFAAIEQGAAWVAREWYGLRTFSIEELPPHVQVAIKRRPNPEITVILDFSQDRTETIWNFSLGA